MGGNSALVSALLIEAPVNRHFAQLHRDERGLTESVNLFVATGLRRGNSVVVIATPEHTALFRNRMREDELDPTRLEESGQLEMLDAHACLSGFMRDGMPSWDEFRQTIGTVLERVRAFGRGTTRAYGEMVNVLWQDGKPEAAIRLEEYWNELARLYPFSLFCSYMLDPHQDQTYNGPVEEIGRCHHEIIGTVEDERFRVALDAASRDVFGVPLSQMVGFSRHNHEGERRFPSGQRTMLWVKRNLPSASAAVLERARRYYQDALQ
jgi:hypothetical protein